MRSGIKWVDAPGRKQSTKLLLRGDDVVGAIMWTGWRWNGFDFNAEVCGYSETERLVKQMVEKKAKEKPMLKVARRIILDDDK